ncbi:MAG: (d)CMP kinase [Rhodospirillaceae bacterium]|jgi:cytidylate kinase|nr:(d)CMP kinase [Rhodospirillaceae bacterium]MBT5514786.1 (d)CMP kinase [Rhodospirillaceae bacterium]MBT6608565.1 (d)CMP kinase [Rhodospirillaceae bacterium]MBT6883309.1 (d)CMP kinase [Rhodospirillaceae bacterium]MBT7510509.1 (d)CMP kinase [Rhodospirillaceae bacterium]
MIIAIDGPAAAGKGTLARRLAEHFNLAYLDTGLIYRAVGRKVLDDGADANDAVAAEVVARALVPADLERDGLRTDETAQAASKVSAVPGVRAALLDFQRDFAQAPPAGFQGAVLDGRDIGTVVCPDADVKIFISADVEVRAKRRVKELQDRVGEAIYARVLEDMMERDARDSDRAVSPLEPAADAHTLDTSNLDADQVLATALEIIGSRDE